MGRFLEENDGSITARTELVNQALKRLPGWAQLLIPAGFFLSWLILWGVFWIGLSVVELLLLEWLFGYQYWLMVLVAVGNMILVAAVFGVVWVNWASAKLILWLDRRRSAVRA